jgi:hypothetical protein
MGKKETEKAKKKSYRSSKKKRVEKYVDKGEGNKGER